MVKAETLCSSVARLLNKYVRQGGEREAGKQKRNHAEHRVWILDRDSCFLVRVGVLGGPEGFFILQLVEVSLVLNRIVHLPIPSENVCWHGKGLSNLDGEFGQRHRRGRRRGAGSVKVAETNQGTSHQNRDRGAGRGA